MLSKTYKTEIEIDDHNNMVEVDRELENDYNKIVKSFEDKLNEELLENDRREIEKQPNHDDYNFILDKHGDSHFVKIDNNLEQVEYDKIKEELLKNDRREIEKRYNAEYYQKNKKTILGNACKKMVCEYCQRTVIANNLKKHHKSKICEDTTKRNERIAKKLKERMDEKSP
jgi:maltodextrin utilization protein YvdJ